MHNAKLRTVARYVIPAICSNVCFFLFTIVDAIFVGRGVGTNALGAINLAGPAILMVGTVNMLISIGGVAIYAIRIGQGDVDGANDVFRHGILLQLCAAAVFSVTGTFLRMGYALCWALTKPSIIWRWIICFGTPFLSSPRACPSDCKTTAAMTTRPAW